MPPRWGFLYFPIVFYKRAALTELLMGQHLLMLLERTAISLI